jgi:hypothetical protein
VRLLDAQIGSQLECDNAHLSNPSGVALTASGLNAAGVSLKGAKVEGGEVRLVGAQLSGNLDCDDAHLANADDYALSAYGLNAASVFLRRAQVEGEVSLVNAQISGHLECDNAHLANPDGYALSAYGLSAADLSLRNNAKVEGAVLLQGAQISGQLDCDDAHLVNPDGYALFGPDCQVGGTLFFRLAKPAVGKVDLSFAQVGPLVDDLVSWPSTFNLRGFSYRSLGGDDTEPSQRLKWLGRSEPFSPDVYTQLGKVYRQTGHEGYARQVAIEREKERACQPDLSWWVRAWRRFLGVSVAYGYQPWRALVPFVVLLALGSVLFALPAAKKAMVPAPDNFGGPASAAEACQNYPCFSPFFYTFDALIPIIDFHQEPYWVPATERRWGWWYMVLTSALIFAGWILLTAVAAGIGSLWRRE